MSATASAIQALQHDEKLVFCPCHLIRYAVGVYNREAGTLEVVPAQGGRVCRIETRLHALDYEPKTHEIQEQEQQDKSTEGRRAQAKR